MDTLRKLDHAISMLSSRTAAGKYTGEDLLDELLRKVPVSEETEDGTEYADWDDLEKLLVKLIKKGKDSLAAELKFNFNDAKDTRKFKNALLILLREWVKFGAREKGIKADHDMQFYYDDFFDEHFPKIVAALQKHYKMSRTAASRTAANLAKTMALGLKIGHSIQVFDDDGELFDWDELTKVILRVLKREKNSADILGVGTKDFKKMVVKMLTMWAKQSAKGLGESLSRDDMDYILDFAEEFANDNESGW
jgi:hypothetical protein